MNESKIAVRYAKAIFYAASEKGLDKTLLDDLKLITDTLRMQELKVLFQSPVIKKSDKEKVFSALFKERVNPLTLNFIGLLLKHNRESYVERITRYYQMLYNKKNGIKIADITLPVPVSKELKEQLKLKLKTLFKSDIELNEYIKPEIIGGFILRIDDELYDASVRNSLQKIRKTLILR